MLLVFYIITLLIPLGLSVIIDDTDDSDFFSVLSVNKILFFVNGMLLGEMSNFTLLQNIGLGAFQVGIYYFAMKLLKKLEYNSFKPMVEIGETGVAYVKIGHGDELGKVLIAGEFYKAATYSNGISAFTPVIVVDLIENSDIIVVEEYFPRRD